MELAQVNVEWQEGVAVARVTGEIDLSNAEDIFSRLALAVQKARFVLLDLSEIQFIASAGIHALFDLSKACVDAGGHMSLVVQDGSPIHNVLLLTDVPRAIGVHHSIEAAVEADGRPPHFDGRPPYVS